MTGADSGAPRYTARPFPAYRFVPGAAPHPTRDPAGHSYARPAPRLARFDPRDWRDCEEYLYGIDLFNHGYWWEAHEALEAVWIAAGRQTRTGQFVQGLIQIGVAHLKQHQGMHDTATRMAGAGLDKLRGLPSPFLGIDLERLRRDTGACFHARRAGPVRIELLR